MRIAPLGDTGLRVEYGSGMDSVANRRAWALAESLRRKPLPGVVDVVPVFGTVTVFYDPLKLRDYRRLCAALKQRAGGTKGADTAGREVVIPVCYAPEHAPDVKRVASVAGLTPAEVAELHQSGEYRVGAIGFLPGFPYLGGLPEKLHTPRLSTPRLAVPGGSVGIGGAQTGIYPMTSPGGWNLIGRTPEVLFDEKAIPPARLRVGDRVRFRAITPEEFAAWK